MSRQQPDPYWARLEQTLRSGLRLAADSVEPSADGLDRIRTRIAAGPPVARQARRRWLPEWSYPYLTGVFAVLSVVGRYVGPVAVKIKYACVGFVEIFS